MVRSILPVLFWIALTAAGLLLVSCGPARSVNSDSPSGRSVAGEPEELVYAVHTMLAVEGELQDYLKASAETVNPSRILVQPQAAGRLVKMNMTVGQQVHAGEVLAEIAIERLGQNPEIQTVAAPVTGTVLAVYGITGAAVTPQDTLGVTDQLEALRLVCSVPAGESSRVENGQAAVVRLTEVPGWAFAARVTAVGTQADPVTGARMVKLAMNDPDFRFTPGKTALVKILTAKKTGILKIPADAVVERSGTPCVFTAGNDGRARLKPVKTGLEVDGKLEVRAGLEPGEAVVIRGQNLLENALKIHVITQVPSLGLTDKVE